EAGLATGEHLELIEQSHATLAGNRGIEGELRSQLDPALTRGVAERAPWLGRRIEVVIQNDDFSRAPRGKIVQGEHTGIHLRITIRQTDLVVRGFLEGRLLRSLGYLTIAVDHPTVGRLGGGVTGTDLVSQLLIPDHLVT